jgi:hypothetical protein
MLPVAGSATAQAFILDNDILQMSRLNLSVDNGFVSQWWLMKEQLRCPFCAATLRSPHLLHIAFILYHLLRQLITVLPSHLLFPCLLYLLTVTPLNQVLVAVL